MPKSEFEFFLLAKSAGNRPGKNTIYSKIVTDDKIVTGETTVPGGKIVIDSKIVTDAKS